MRSDDLEARTSDPFQAGVTAILGLVAGAALLFALVGLAISLWYTVSSRRGEFAVARALGLGRRQMLGWLAIESAFLIVVGVVGGILVGLVLAWVVMPSITLTTRGPCAGAATGRGHRLGLFAVGLLGLGALAFLLSVLAARRAIASVRVAATVAHRGGRSVSRRAGAADLERCTWRRLDLRADRAGTALAGHPVARHDDRSRWRRRSSSPRAADAALPTMMAAAPPLQRDLAFTLEGRLDGPPSDPLAEVLAAGEGLCRPICRRAWPARSITA